MEENIRNIRIDVQVKLNRMVEMMQRPQGASVSEVCQELNCNHKTFYRYLDKLLQLDILYESKPDPEGITNSVRYYVPENEVFCSNISLNSSEKALFRMMLQSSKPLFSDSNEKISARLYEKLKNGISHDTKESSCRYVSDDFTLSRKWEITENFRQIANALEMKQSVTFRTIRKSGMKNEEAFISDEENSFFLPYTLLNKNGIFHVFGKVIPFGTLDKENSASEKIRCVPVESLSEIKTYRKYTYRIPADYDFSKWFSFYFQPESEKQNYNLEVDAETLKSITDACEYYPVERTEGNGRTTLSFCTDRKNEFAKYVRTLGKGAKVLSPESFAEEILQDYKSMISVYEEKAPD